ncbi:MAG: hypothetical protein H7232_16675 [Aeromicrobium sp.]|nr:hypothetical protein [Burkholderiales bacterium]
MSPLYFNAPRRYGGVASIQMTSCVAGQRRIPSQQFCNIAEALAAAAQFIGMKNDEAD